MPSIPNIVCTNNPINCGAEWSLTFKIGTYKEILSTSNATPIVVTIPNHGYTTGETKVISQATDLAANGTWVITRIDANTFSLDSSAGITGGSRKGYVMTPSDLTGYTSESEFKDSQLGRLLTDSAGEEVQPDIEITDEDLGEITISFSHEQTEDLQPMNYNMAYADVFIVSGSNRYKKATIQVPIIPAITT